MLLIGDLSELQEKDYGDKKRVSRHSSTGSIHEFEPGMLLGYYFINNYLRFISLIRLNNF